MVKGERNTKILKNPLDSTYKKQEEKAEKGDELGAGAKIRVLCDRLAIELGNSETKDPRVLVQQIAECFDPLASEENPVVKPLSASSSSS
jgi:hypothetical protein